MQCRQHLSIDSTLKSQCSWTHENNKLRQQIALSKESQHVCNPNLPCHLTKIQSLENGNAHVNQPKNWNHSTFFWPKSWLLGTKTCLFWHSWQSCHILGWPRMSSRHLTLPGAQPEAMMSHCVTTCVFKWLMEDILFRTAHHQLLLQTTVRKKSTKTLRFFAQKHRSSQQREDHTKGSWAEPLSNVTFMLVHFLDCNFHLQNTQKACTPINCYACCHGVERHSSCHNPDDWVIK